MVSIVGVSLVMKALKRIVHRDLALEIIAVIWGEKKDAYQLCYYRV